MAKDVNIHLKTTGAAQTKQQLEEVGRASQQLGQQTAAAQGTGAEAVDKTTQKMTGLGRVLGNLKSAVMGFVGAWLGLQGVQRVISYLIARLERIQQLQRDIYEKAIDMAEIGQALEFQTGTRGMQQYWTEQAIRLQQAGALVSAQVAQQMMVSMDIAFAQQGGIRDRRIMELAMQLAPFVGAARLGPEEVSKVFEFAGVAGIAPTAQAYKEYFAKLQAGYTASKAVDFGQFMMGLQKGGTAFMAMGGTLEEAISAFAAARAVMANEALAATLVEQVARLSGGGYKKPRMAIERQLGVQWAQLSMDERMRALLQYVGDIPEARRGEVLEKEGFPVELTTQIGKMVSPEARRTMEATRRQVAEATSEMIDELTQAYLDSILAEERRTEARIALRQVKRAPQFADWQQRLKEAKAEHEDLVTIGMDRWIKDSIEPHVIAIEKMQDELDELLKTLPEGPSRTQVELLRKRIAGTLLAMKGPGPVTTYPEVLLPPGPRLFYPPSLAARRGQEFTEQLKALYDELRQQGLIPEMPELEQKIEPPAEPIPVGQAEPVPVTEVVGQVSPTTVTHYYDNSIKFFPHVGDDERGPRFTQVG